MSKLQYMLNVCSQFYRGKKPKAFQEPRDCCAKQTLEQRMMNYDCKP